MTENKNGWAIILAAGASSRFGSAKALAPWKGGTLLSNVINTAKQVFDDKVLCVTGGYAEQIQSHLSGTYFVYNENWQKGLGTSISAGIKEVLAKDPRVPLITLIPVDQPLITATHLKNLIEKVSKTKKCVMSQDKEILGPPATIPLKLYSELLNLNGDKGLKSVFSKSQVEIVIGNNVLVDIDTHQDLENLKELNYL